MSLLSNNSEALAMAGRLSQAELETKLGRLPETEGRVLAALYNADTEGKMNMLLHTNPAGIVAGLAAAVKLSGAKGAVLITDCDINEQEYTAAAATAGVELEIERAEMVNKTAHKQDLMMTFEELAALAERMTGNEPGIFLAVDDEVPVEADPQAPVKSFLPAEGCRGIRTGHCLYTPAELEGVKIKDLHTWGGVIRTIRETDCAVDLAAKEVLALRKKSCGKCTFCREGLIQLHTMTKEITQGKGKGEYLDMMEEIGQAMVFSTPCSVGQTGSRFTLDAMSLFAEEYEDHIKRRKCKNNVCSAFTSIYIDPSLCQGCEDCVDVCPEDCIEGKAGYIHMIDDFDCTKCGKCIDACDYDAIVRSSGRLPKLPSRLTKCGKFR